MILCLPIGEKSRRLLKRTVELRPANLTFSLEILYIFLKQWDDLDESEKRLVFSQIKRKWYFSDSLVGRWRERWIHEFGNDAGLKKILSRDPSVWPQIRSLFK